ncbi:MAG: NosD domain-containing protein, partial [Opitutaceae bacterium]
DGHGIEVAGSTAAGSSIEGCRIGYDNTNGSASANLGSGIRIAPGSKDILVGSRVAVSESEVNSIGGNQDHGILVEGPGLERIRINAATIGTVYYGSQTPKALGNGIHGIALTGGASGVTVGDRNDRFRTFITHHVEGAGIYLAGTETRDNSISGAVIGRPDNLAVFSLGSGGAGNAIGIHITAGAHGTQVGIPGELVRSPEYDNGAIRPWNEIENNNVGIQIESGGDPSQTIPSDKNTPFAPRGANVVVNNRIGHIKDPQVFNDTDRGNAIGIVLTGNAAQNRIGGPGPAEGNLIHGSGSVGLLIQGVTHDRPELANRIIGNEFKGTGTLIENPVDPREGSITSAAILLHAGTANQIIGGNNPGEGNLITDGLIGIGLEGANANVITGNEIGGFRITGFPNSIFTQNRQAGIFLIASAGNRIGPGNTIAGNGRPDGPALGGIYLRLSSGNFIVGNTLGNLPVSQLRRNEPGNILVDNSPDNLIGLPGPDGPNVIGLGAGSGVHLFGALSYGNIIDSNFVGTDGNNAALANATEGILIDGDASANLVQNNTIFGNGTDGVRISGLNTAENRLSLNSISGHTNGKGIRLEGSANSGIQPPELTTVNGFDLLGSAPAGTPDNSLVEVFHDPDDEGLIPFGLVTVRNEEFSFNAALNPGLTLTATLTDPDGNTSEFSSVLTLSTNKLSTLDLRRREGAPEERSAPANPVALAILPMVLTAPPDFAAAVESVTFEASGSIDESADLQGLALFRDEDDDGLLTSRDTMISPVGTIDVDDGEVTLTPDATLQAGSRESWLLAAIPKNGIAPGSTLIFRLVSAENVASRVFSSNAAISETGVFPIVSDTVTLIEPVDAYDQWREDTFSPEDAANDAVSGRNADPDEDGIPNLLEFALGTNPGDPDPWNNAQISLAGDHYVFQIPTDVSMADSTVLAEASSDLVAWSSGQEVADLVGMMEDGIGGFLVVVKVPLPLDEATPVFVRLVFESAGP